MGGQIVNVVIVAACCTVFLGLGRALEVLGITDNCARDV